MEWINFNGVRKFELKFKKISKVFKILNKLKKKFPSKKQEELVPLTKYENIKPWQLTFIPDICSCTLNQWVPDEQ